MRKKRQPQVSRSARGRDHRLRRSATGRLAWRRSIAVFVPLGLLLLTLLASSGQARPAAEATPEAEALALSERAALREERQLARRAKHESKWATGGERNNVVVKTSCTSVTWEYRNFPDLPGNTVTQKITINGVSTFAKYVFDGPSSTTVTNFNAPPGQYKIDARGKWKTNGVKGTFDIGISVRCASAPGFAVEKLQQIEGAGGSFTTGALTGHVGQTIDYEFIVRNTGNVPMTFGTFSDARCDEGTISGGPGGEAVPAGGSSTYLCKHLLTAADETAGTVTNSVTITGSPPEGEEPPIEETSNTVVVGVLPPEPPTPEPPPNPGSKTGTPSSGVAASTTTQTPQSGVLASAQSSAVPALKMSVPRLSGPQGCVRSAFRASIKSKGVSSVGFYLDGHRLKTMTAKSARKGLIAITVDPTKLSVGPHKLMAKITMAKASASSKAVRGTRTAAVLRCRAAVLTPKFTG